MTTAAEILSACNEYRVSRGLPALTHGDAEQCIAQRWAERMAATGEFKHGGGEQIIERSSDELPASAVISVWRNSAPHDMALRSAKAIAGFGVAHGKGWWYYAGAFDGGLPGFGSPVRRPWLSWLIGWFGR